MTEEQGTYLMNRIRKNCREQDGCLIWRGACSTGKYPAMRLEGKTVLVRHVMWRELGKSPDRKAVTSSCGEDLCVAPEHLKADRRGPKEGMHYGMAHKIKATRNARERSGLTAADIEEIRSSTEASEVIAVKYGKSSRTIRKIRRGDTFRPTLANVWMTPTGVTHA